MSHEYRMEQLRAAIAAARKNFKKDANFFVVGLTYGCLRGWIEIANFGRQDFYFFIYVQSLLKIL